jgi:putative aminopeptidase FrvX
MQKDQLAFLQDLLTTPSPSGSESPAQKVWCDYVRDHADDIETDAYGNARAILNPDGDPTVLIDGHIDEIGLMVKHISKEGFIYFQRIGGVNPALCAGKRVRIHTAKGEVRGVIGATAIHLRDRDKKPEVPKMHQLFIDIGASDGKSAEKKVAVGDPITFVDDFEKLDGNVAVSRAMDNRVGCWVAGEVLRCVARSKTKPRCRLVAASSIQEETGLNGAQMQVHAVQPDLAIAVDVTHATDTPGIDVKEHGEVKLGKGPTVSLGRENHPALVKRLRDVAKKKKIPLQIETFSTTGGTDAYAFWTKLGGIPSAIVSPPTRYMHSTVELMDLRDLTKLADWLSAFVLDLKNGERFTVKI